MASVVNVFGMPIQLLPSVLSLALVSLICARINSILRLQRQKHSQAIEVIKDGIDIVYEGPNAEVE